MAATNKTPKRSALAQLSEADLKEAADYIVRESARRSESPARRELVRRWKEIDRQLKMTPYMATDESGRPLAATSWITEIEMPQQAQALEVLVSDAHRLLFPDDRRWFTAHGSMEEAKLDSLKDKNLIPGLTDRTEDNIAKIVELSKMTGNEPAIIDQQDVDDMIEGAMSHYHSLYDYRMAWTMLNAQAFSYGTFVGRVKKVSRDKNVNEFRGIQPRDNVMIPRMIPRSVKNVLLDDSPQIVMNDGMMVAPAYIESFQYNLDQLRLAASKGDTNPENENGGWVRNALDRLEPKEKQTNLVDFLEYEGDLIIPQGMTRPIFLPDVIFTVVVGQGGEKRVIRRRKREFPFRSYFHGCYHRDDLESPYGTSPLMLGYPIQIALTECVNRMQQAAVLNVSPPVRYNPADHYLKARGGPEIAPNAMWEALSDIVPQKIGDPAALREVVILLLKMYEEVTGVSAPRLGAQTKSHQTLGAIDSEITRGLIRTVRYISALMFGALPTCLSMEYEIAKKTLRAEPVYIPARRQYVKLSGSDLPDMVTFDVFGAAGPVERREREERMLRALMTALKIEPMALQLGGKPLDLDKVREKILEEGGFTDPDQFFRQPGPAGSGGLPLGAQDLTAITGGAGVVPGPGAPPGTLPLAAR